jgi:hypothetical protein
VEVSGWILRSYFVYFEGICVHRHITFIELWAADSRGMPGWKVRYIEDNMLYIY